MTPSHLPQKGLGIAFVLLVGCNQMPSVPRLEGKVVSAQVDIQETKIYALEPKTIHVTDKETLERIKDYIAPCKIDTDKVDDKAYPVLAKVQLKMDTGHVYKIDVRTVGKNPALVSIDGTGYFWCSNTIAPNGDGALAFVQFVNKSAEQEGE